jgi:hypothetical protein
MLGKPTGKLGCVEVEVGCTHSCCKIAHLHRNDRRRRPCAGELANAIWTLS